MSTAYVLGTFKFKGKNVPKIEDIPIGIPFVYTVVNEWEIVKVNDTECAVRQLDGCSEDWTLTSYADGGPGILVDWFDVSESTTNFVQENAVQEHSCSCHIVMLMQGGCKCGGK